MSSNIYGTGADFKNKLGKIKKSTPKKNSLYFGKWNFLTLILRNFLYFLNRKLSLYFGKRKPRKNSLYFRKRSFLIFLEELPKPQKPKFLIFLQKKLRINFSKNTYNTNNSFHLFYKVNQAILLVYKNIESFLLC